MNIKTPSQPFFRREKRDQTRLLEYQARTGFDYANHRTQVKANYDTLANTFTSYQSMLTRLQKLENLEICSMSSLAKERRSDRKRLGLRHDIDADPEMGVEMAKLLNKYEVEGTFYLLHSAPYYGQFFETELIRNPLVEDWVCEINNTGVELGLHTDPLGIALNQGINGCDALLVELSWLRSLGARISGTAAHNSFPVHRAENFDFFHEYCLWDRELEFEQLVGSHLATLSAVSLGLEYEANLPQRIQIDHSYLEKFLSVTPDLSSAEWVQSFLGESPYMNRGYDVDIWLVGKDRWIVCDRSSEVARARSNCTFDQVFDFLAELPSDSDAVMVLHPEYFQLG